MPHKKSADDQLTAEEQELQKRVYDMMELDRSKQAEAESAKKAPPPPLEPIPAPTELEPEADPEPAPALVAPTKRPPVNLDDATDRVVDEIVISEGDALLAAEDLAAQLKTVSPRPKSKSIFGRLFGK